MNHNNNNNHEIDKKKKILTTQIKLVSFGTSFDFLGNSLTMKNQGWLIFDLKKNIFAFISMTKSYKQLINKQDNVLFKKNKNDKIYEIEYVYADRPLNIIDAYKDIISNQKYTIKKCKQLKNEKKIKKINKSIDSVLSKLNNINYIKDKMVTNQLIYGKISQFQVYDYKKHQRNGSLIKTYITNNFYSMEIITYNNEIDKIRTQTHLQKIEKKIFNNVTHFIIINGIIDTTRSQPIYIFDDKTIFLPIKSPIYNKHKLNDTSKTEFFWNNYTNIKNIQDDIQLLKQFEKYKTNLKYDGEIKLMLMNQTSIGNIYHKCNYNNVKKTMKIPSNSACVGCGKILSELILNPNTTMTYSLKCRMLLDNYTIIKAEINGLDNILKIFEFFNIKYKTIDEIKQLTLRTHKFNLSDLDGKTITLNGMALCNYNLYKKTFANFYIVIENISNIQLIKKKQKESNFYLSDSDNESMTINDDMSKMEDYNYEYVNNLIDDNNSNVNDSNDDFYNDDINENINNKSYNSNNINNNDNDNDNQNNIFNENNINNENIIDNIDLNDENENELHPTNDELINQLNNQNSKIYFEPQKKKRKLNSKN